MTEPCRDGELVYCEQCPWEGLEEECYIPGAGCVCPDCGSLWGVTEGKRPVAFPRECSNCKHCGADPDGAYCAAPKVLEKWPYGRSLCSVNAPTRKGKECGPDRKLWEFRG